jgi:dTDP-4-dehydrorhamnose reductase
MEKLIITGVNGLLGQKLLEQGNNKYTVLGIDIQEAPFNKKTKFKYHQLDITKRRQLKELVSSYQPDYIVNTAAMTDVDGCETLKEKCWKINVEAVENLIYAVRKTGTKIIQLSSDYVFDGKNGPYSETSVPKPLGYYGKSKLASENLLISAEIESAIVRTMVLYGDGIEIRPNFVTWLIEKLKNGESLKIVNDQFGNPTLVDDLAGAIFKVIERKKWDLYHVSGSELIDRYNFALKVADVFKLNKNLITPITTPELKQPAPRPLKSGFIIDKARADLDIEMSNGEEGLKKLKKQSKKFILF